MLDSLEHWIPYLAGVFVLVTATYVLARTFHIGIGTLPYVAILRAVVQLAIIALALRGIFAFPAAAPLFIAVMLTTASLTSGRHARHLHRGKIAAALGIVAGAGVTLTGIFTLGLIDFTTQNLIAMSGIIIGGTMTIVTLTARHFVSQLKHRVGEVEGWWALGAPSPVAFADVRRESIREALTPGLDQTKATGLVTLPGTFIGALMGGASPTLAAQMQVAVLAGQTLSGLIAALIFTAIITRATRFPIQAS